MTIINLTRVLGAAMIACLAFAHEVRAQAAAQPSASAVATAREIVEAKGALTMFDSVIVGVIQYHKDVLLQSNPTLQKDLDDVSARLSAEFAPRRAAVQAEIARAYASRFSEAELKELLAFYRTALGKKVITEEPKAVDDATKRVDQWASKFAEEVLTRIRAEMKKKGHNL